MNIKTRITRYRPRKRITLFGVLASIAILFLVGHLSMSYGAQRERKRVNKEVEHLEKCEVEETNVRTAEAICVDIQKRKLKEIEDKYQEKVITAEEETKKWKSYYLYQKIKNEEFEKEFEEVKEIINN